MAFEVELGRSAIHHVILKADGSAEVRSWLAADDEDERWMEELTEKLGPPIHNLALPPLMQSIVNAVSRLVKGPLNGT